jgi:hypothetical protein
LAAAKPRVAAVTTTADASSILVSLNLPLGQKAGAENYLDFVQVFVSCKFQNRVSSQKTVTVTAMSLMGQSLPNCDVRGASVHSSISDNVAKSRASKWATNGLIQRSKVLFLGLISSAPSGLSITDGQT